MIAIETAKTRVILHKRLQRLLRFDRGAEDKSELSARIMPLLSSLGAVVLIGGAIRDVARVGKRGFFSDLDFVVYNGSKDDFVMQMERHRAIRNKFGGYGLRCFQVKVDVWHIDDTWAKTAGLVDVTKPEDLLNCTFFDWDSAIYEIHSRKLVLADDYLKRLHSNIMDIRLEENPNPRGSLVRALRRAAQWRVKFGPRLTAFSYRYLQEIPWEELVSLDARAFSVPVLKYLDRDRILSQLQCSAGNVTLPVPNWVCQMDLPFDYDSTDVSPRIDD